MLVWTSGRPHSADPLEYDDFVHHIAFRAVLAPLVSQYRVGEFTGVVARSWTFSEDQRVWSFRIRKGLQFENGDEITPEVVSLSLRRMAFLLKKRGSRNDLLEHLDGLVSLNSPVGVLAGIQARNDEVVLRFNRSVPKALELLSFGLYSIVHPGDFDPKSGAWKHPRIVTSSSHYRVSKWDDEAFVIALRPDFLPEARHPTAAKEVRLIIGAEQKTQAHVVIGTTLDPLDAPGYQLFAGAPSGIVYAACRSWKLKDNPLNRLESRIALRDGFYEKLGLLGIQHSRSFFPPVMKGVSQIVQSTGPEGAARSASEGKKSSKLSVLRYHYSSSVTKLRRAFNQAVETSAERMGIRWDRKTVSDEVFKREYDPDLKEYTADLYFLRTGILVEDPDADIRFMFLSQEGIRLPDADGRIHKELERPRLDVQRINQLIWDQAIIWPVTHFADGMWARDEVDLSMLNLILPPTDFSWIGWKR